MKLENARITLIKEKQTGVSKAGKAWSKVEFLVETDETYNNLYCFSMFQMDDQEDDKKKIVDNFLKYNKVNTNVDIDFNVKTKEWNEKHFIELAAWKVFKADSVETPTPVEPDNSNDDLPF